MKYRFTILFCWLITGFTTAHAQQVSFIKYTMYDGLVSNPVRCIYQDKKGFIWIGTYDGLSRYDGYKFSNYTSINGLSHNLVNDIFEVEGKLLIAENNGSVDEIENNTILQNPYKAPSAVNFFGVYNNRLLATTDENGFYEYKNDSIFTVSKQKTNPSLGHFISLNDSLIICTGIDVKIFLYRNDFNVIDSLELPGLFIYTIIIDSKKRIWACTGRGLRMIKYTTGKFPKLSLVPVPAIYNISPLNDASITSMIEEKDGSFWIGTLKGLVRLFPDGNFHVYNEKDGLPSARIQSLYLDKEKNVWIGTTLGLAKWVSQNNVIFYNTESQDFRNDVVTISNLSDQKIILKTDKGLQDFNFNTREFKNIIVPGNHDPVPISGTSPLLVYYADWIGILDHEKNRVVPFTKSDTAITGVTSTLMNHEGTVFLGSFSGLYAIYKKSVKKILPWRITSITMDKNGSIWAGTWSEGLFRITKNNTEKSMYDVVEMTSQINKQAHIRGLYIDSKNNIWVGTRYGGAFCLIPKEKDRFDIQPFTTRSGLMSDWVMSFAELKNGDMWIGTYLGIDRIVKEDSGYRIFNFSKAVNFFAEIKKIVQFNDYWICVANTGIAVFKDENLHQSSPLEPVIFSSGLGVLENMITIFSPTDKVTLKPYQNAAKFEFGALSFLNERSIMYSYRLMGISDTSWSKPENIHEASYANLSPGNYTFEVKSLGWNGEYSKPVSFSFIISTPFWKQWWFIGLCAALVAAIVFALYRYRIKQIMRLQKVRNTIATDLHDDIGSALTNISILAELSRNKNQQNAFSENLPGRISEESIVAQQALDDIIWSVNSNNDTLNQTMARMRRYAAEVFEPVGINCNLDFENIPGDIKLNMEQRKDIYLVFKECLNNVIKHASAKNVFIKIEVERNVFQLKIADDGKGFDTLKQTDRNGLKNIRSRIQRWTGKLSINSTANEGTTVDCDFPLASPK
jgi:ligand-binding sensor domain-containing protein/two-component sensor histidine kinase